MTDRGAVTTGNLRITVIPPSGMLRGATCREPLSDATNPPAGMSPTGFYRRTGVTLIAETSSSFSVRSS
jgi:hypothetical protein